MRHIFTPGFRPGFVCTATEPSPTLLRQQRRHPPPKFTQLLLLPIAERSQPLRIRIHPCYQPIKAVGLKMHALMAVTTRQQSKQLTPLRWALTHRRGVLLEHQLLKVFIRKPEQTPIRLLSRQIQRRRLGVTTARTMATHAALVQHRLHQFVESQRPCPRRPRRNLRCLTQRRQRSIVRRRSRLTRFMTAHT